MGREGLKWHPREASTLRKGEVVFIETNDVVPADAEVVEGVASVDESAITGESAPVIRESGGDFLRADGRHPRVVRLGRRACRCEPRRGPFVDRMIAMVEGAQRKRTPNEIALTILLVALTLVFLGVCATLLPFSQFSVAVAGSGEPVGIVVLVALLVCLIPTTIAGLLSAVGVAGMSRMLQANVIATSGRAVEAAGDVDVLLLDKTGTITLGNRQADAFWPVEGASEAQLAEAARLASLADETPEGRSIVALAERKFGAKGAAAEGSVFVPFTAQTRMSGVDLGARQIRKGAGSAVRAHVEALGGRWPASVQSTVDEAARRGSTPLVVADGIQVLGVVELKDIVKPEIKERFAQLRRMGIKTIMVTGDNRLTAAAIAAEAGVDDFMAEATPEAKLTLIREHQGQGRLVAMTGDGTNDAPALAQADVAVAMNSGTQAAKEAGNMVDLGQQPHQAHRGRRDRQADAYDAGVADDLQHRQRPGQVLRRAAGGLRVDLPAAVRAERHAPGQPQLGHPVGRHLQRADHRRADPAGPEGRALPRHRRRCTAAPQPAGLRPGWRDRAFHRHQGHRPHPCRARPDLNAPQTELKNP